MPPQDNLPDSDSHTDDTSTEPAPQLEPEKESEADLSDASEATIPVPIAAGTIQVDSVNRSFWQFIWRYHRWQFIAFLIGSLLWELLMIYASSLASQATGNSSNGGSFVVLAFVPLIVLALEYYRLQEEIEATFLEQFAINNGYSFSVEATLEDVYASIFNVGDQALAYDMIRGDYGDCSCECFYMK